LHALPEGSDPYSGIPETLLAELRSPNEHDPITQVSRFEIRGFLGQILLRDGDISSLANQLELRTPILEHRVVELAVQLPGAWKKPDPRNKPLLIDAVGPRFPQVLLNKPKRGFALPWKPWLLGPLAAQAEATLREQDVWRRIGFQPEVPLLLWNRFRAGDRCIAATQILALMVLASYVKQHQLSR
jgi:asparagine synthase (glutamine-hydrolysing)